jgi:CRISPR-associated protein Cas2
MPMTLVVTRDVEDRYRGFLTSIMLEVAPGLWTVLDAWWTELRRGAIVMAWREPKAVGGIGLRTLGEPPKEIVDADGVLLLKRL